MRMPKLSGIAVLTCAILGACSDLTKIDRTGIVQPSAQNNAIGAVALYAGATQKFVTATNNSILFSGLFSDELVDAWGSGLVFGFVDARRPQNSGNQTGQELGEYSNTLVALRFAANGLRQFAPTPGSRLGQMYSYQGFMETYLADQFCNGIPFSTIDFDGVVTYGPAVSTVDTYGRAIAHFDSAAAVSADSARVLNLTRVGKGRALLNLAKYPEAAAAVAAVPTNFVYNLDINAAITAQQNSNFGWIVTQKRVGVPAAGQGINGINWAGANDPRVPVAANGKGFDGTTDVYRYTPWSSLGSPVPIATGVEARLIQAEAALQANNNDAAPTGSGWLGILNSLRAGYTTPMAPLADPGSYPARVDLLFRERAFWLYLQAVRMPDLRRLMRQYNRAQETVFPTGPYRDGLQYGTEVNFTAPLNETPNTAYTGCIDRKA
jgi:hypothetical protein